MSALAARVLDWFGRTMDRSVPVENSVFPVIDYTMHPYYRSIREAMTPAEKAAAHKLFQEEFARTLAAQQRYEVYARTHSAPTLPAALHQAIHALQEEGIVAMRMEAAERAEMLALSAPAVDTLLAKRETLAPEDRTVTNVSAMLCKADAPDATYAFFDGLMRRHDVYDLCHAARGMPYQLKFVTLQINQRPSSKDEGLSTGLKAGATDVVCACFSSSHTLKPSGVSS